MMDVPLAGRALRRRGGLRLPVEQLRRDRVVAVACRGGVVLLALLQGDEEVVGVGGRVPEGAFAVAEGFGQTGPADGGEGFVAGVEGVDLEGDIVKAREVDGVGAMGGAVVEDLEELAQFVAYGGLAAEALNGGREVAFLVAPHHQHEAFDDAAIADGEGVEGEVVFGGEALEQRQALFVVDVEEAGEGVQEALFVG